MNAQTPMAGMDLADAELGMAWWNQLSRFERAQWLARANSAVPAEAWAAWKAQQAPPEHGQEVSRY